MKKKYKIVVAHPDDELIFFSSILKSASKIIICYTKSKDKSVNIGRNKIKNISPFKNWLFLNQKETDEFNLDDLKFNKNYQQIKLNLSEVLNVGDTIFTHNPWGEYGHQDHVMVFTAIKNLSKKLKLTIFVSGYVSNNTTDLMKKKHYLFSNDFYYRKIDHNFNKILKKKYILNSCWTFDNEYIWPNTEVFFKINKKAKYKKINTSSPALNIMLDNYKINFFKKFLVKILGYRLIKELKKLIYFLKSKK